MCLNGGGVKKENEITIFPRAMIYGPYIKMAQGRHRIIIVVDLPNAATVEGVITAEAGQLQIATKKLRQGRNDFFFELDRPRKNIEVIINNTTDSNIILSGVQFD